jgi:uncharacterized membrane protein
MTKDRQAQRDARLEVVIGYTLRLGVITAAALIFTGGMFFLIENRATALHYETFHAALRHSDNLAGMVQNIRNFSSEGIIQLGLLVLIATPILRVIFSLVAFALERDIVYVFVTAIVLAVLLYSVIGRGGR